MTRLLAAALLLAVPAAARAQEPAGAHIAVPFQQRGEDVVAVLKGGKPMRDVFADSFIAVLPEPMLRSRIAQVEAQFGPIQGLQSITANPDVPGGASIRLRFAKALATGEIQLEPAAPFKVIGLRLTKFESTDAADPAAVLNDLEKLPGATGVLLTRLGGNGKPLLSYNQDRQFAIGSTFKLYVLAALTRQILAGKRHWDDVVHLGERSFPSGQMQNWPPNSPVTLQTLATMMISISDNTAADTLVRLLGPEALADEIRRDGHADPSRMIPLLTTEQAFGLRTLGPDRITQYAAADDKKQTQLLQQWAPELAHDKVNIAPFLAGKPLAIDKIEYFASPSDIVRVLDAIRKLGSKEALDILAVNTGLGDGANADWSYVGSKGGSEPGVINLSWLVRDKAGNYYALSMSWNNTEAAVDEGTFALLGRRALSLIAGK